MRDEEKHLRESLVAEYKINRRLREEVANHAAQIARLERDLEAAIDQLAGKETPTAVLDVIRAAATHSSAYYQDECRRLRETLKSTIPFLPEGVRSPFQAILSASEESHP